MSATMQYATPLGRVVAAKKCTRNDLIRCTNLSPARLSQLINVEDERPTIAETAYLAKALGCSPRLINPDLTPDQL